MKKPLSYKEDQGRWLDQMNTQVEDRKAELFQKRIRTGRALTDAEYEQLRTVVPAFENKK